jgi:FKBP-type peptidyl-prolyl cis-trans isomerase
MAQTPKPVPVKKAAAVATTPAKATVAKKPIATIPAKPVIVLKNANDSLSYAIGVLDGSFFKTQGLDKVNADLLGEAFAAVLKGNTVLTPEQADQIVRKGLKEVATKKIQPVIDACNNFLAENAKRPGVKTTPSGLQYEVIVEGKGPKPADTSKVKVHYEGFLINATRPFDSSRDRGEPVVFPLNGVIKGWTEGVQLMPVGSRYKLYVPYQLGYGEQGAGESIPGGSTLIFDVELLEIVN